MIVRNGTSLKNILMGSGALINWVFQGTAQVWAREIVIVLPNSGSLDIKPLFDAVDAGLWISDTSKRVVVPTGVVINSTLAAYALRVSVAWGGTLTIDMAGFINGLGGTINSGVGGTALQITTLGLTGQKLVLNRLDGGLRGGGGGGGRAGNGGQGVWYSARTITEGPYYQAGYSWQSWTNNSTTVITWANNSWTLYDGGWGTSYAPGDGWTYYRGSLADGSIPGNSFYYIYRRRSVVDVPNYTAGGVAGNAGRGQGSDGAAGPAAGPVAGGTNAGASGTSGAGGPYGQNGTAGTNGASGNYTGGTAGLAGGLAGFAIDGSTRVDIIGTGGVLLGRL